MSDRKYSQKGYQDDRGDSKSSRARSPKERPEGPRGRGLGAPGATVSQCARCGAELSAPPTFDQTCAGCGSDLHTCTNCRHLDPSARYECRLPIEIRISSKSKRNRCESFERKVVQQFESDSSGGAKDAKAAFDDLFNF